MRQDLWVEVVWGFFQLLVGLRTDSEETGLNSVSETKTTNILLLNVIIPYFVSPVPNGILELQKGCLKTGQFSLIMSARPIAFHGFL